MLITPETAKGGSSNFQNQNYFFCSLKCKTKFDLTPTTYLKNKNDNNPQALDTEYTCPMHPAVKQIGPGSCPICGMDLEPLIFSAAHREDQTEYLIMLKKFWVSEILSIPLVALTMGARHLIADPQFQSYLPWLELVLATPVVLWGGAPFFVRFWQSLKTRI